METSPISRIVLAIALIKQLTAQRAKTSRTRAALMFALAFYLC